MLWMMNLVTSNKKKSFQSAMLGLFFNNLAKTYLIFTLVILKNKKS